MTSLLKTAYHAMNSLSGVVNRLFGWVAGLLIALCASALLFQVLYRFVIVKFLSFSFPFTEEFARYALIWSAYLCLGMNLKEGSQAAVNFLYDRLRGAPKLALYCVTRVFVAVFLIVALYYGFKVVQINSIFKSASLRIPGVYLYSAPVFGCILMLYETANELFGVLSGELEPFATDAGSGEEDVSDANTDNPGGRESAPTDG